MLRQVGFTISGKMALFSTSGLHILGGSQEAKFRLKYVIASLKNQQSCLPGPTVASGCAAHVFATAYRSSGDSSSSTSPTLEKLGSIT